MYPTLFLFKPNCLHPCSRWKCWTIGFNSSSISYSGRRLPAEIFYGGGRWKKKSQRCTLSRFSVKFRRHHIGKKKRKKIKRKRKRFVTSIRIDGRKHDLEAVFLAFISKITTWEPSLLLSVWLGTETPHVHGKELVTLLWLVTGTFTWLLFDFLALLVEVMVCQSC